MEFNTPGFPVHHQLPELPKLISIKSVMLSNHLILRRPLLLPSIFPSIRIFASESVLHIRWPKYWSFSLGISPSNEYSGLISFRMDYFDLLTYSPRDSQESSPTPQFKSISSLVLSFLYSPTLCDPMDCSTPDFPVHQQLPELAQIHIIESVMPSNHSILCHCFSFPPSIFPSTRVFSNESVLLSRWPKD